MKKSIFLSVLALVVLFGLAACGGDEKPKQSDECEMLSVTDGTKQWTKSGTTFSYLYDKEDVVTALNLTIVVSDKADFAPKAPYNFGAAGGSTTITVTAESGKTQTFTLTANKKTE